jgi:hypothetical protein
MSLSAPLYLAVVTLFDQLEPNKHVWEQLVVILNGQPSIPPRMLLVLFESGTKLDIEFSRIVSKFLMDRTRAGSLWVNPQTYVNLATQLLNILRDK